MSPIKEAIVFLQAARDKLETELHHRGAYYQTEMTSDLQDLSDAIEDIGPILCTLESFGDLK